MRPRPSHAPASAPSPRWRSTSPLFVSARVASFGLAAGLGVLVVGCDGDAKKSESAAVGHVDRLAKLADADVEEIRRGLPVGAQKLVTGLFEKEKEPFDPRVVRNAMRKARESTTDLQLAKATFSAVLSPTGEVFASDQESDSLVSKNLFKAYPSIDGVQKGKYTEGFGDFVDLRGARTGDDLQWVAATPIGAQEAPKGYFVAGWSIRSFAYHLEQQLKSDLRNAQTDKKKEPPLLYVFVVTGGKAFGAPITPEVNRTAVEALQVLDKAPEARHGRMDIDNRSFGWAAQSTKNLGEKTAIVVLRSEV